MMRLQFTIRIWFGALCVVVILLTLWGGLQRKRNRENQAFIELVQQVETNCVGLSREDILHRFLRRKPSESTVPSSSQSLIDSGEDAWFDSWKSPSLDFELCLFYIWRDDCFQCTDAISIPSEQLNKWRVR